MLWQFLTAFVVRVTDRLKPWLTHDEEIQQVEAKFLKMWHRKKVRECGSATSGLGNETDQLYLLENSRSCNARKNTK